MELLFDLTELNVGESWVFESTGSKTKKLTSGVSGILELQLNVARIVPTGALSLILYTSEFGRFIHLERRKNSLWLRDTFMFLTIIVKLFE